MRAAASSGCVRDHCEDRAAGVVATPLERVVDGPTARTHATATACHLSCLGMCGVDQFQPSTGREGVGGRVAGERDPKARDSVGSGPRASGFPPPQATLARARGGRTLLLRHPASMNPVRGLPPPPSLHRTMASLCLQFPVDCYKPGPTRGLLQAWPPLSPGLNVVAAGARS